MGSDRSDKQSRKPQIEVWKVLNTETSALNNSFKDSDIADEFEYIVIDQV